MVHEVVNHQEGACLQGFEHISIGELVDGSGWFMGVILKFPAENQQKHADYILFGEDGGSKTEATHGPEIVRDTRSPVRRFHQGSQNMYPYGHGSITYGSIFWADEHPFATYFDVDNHSHMGSVLCFMVVHPGQESELKMGGGK